ncbi:rhodanese-like domain-containing protein [Fibrella aquatica]|jgi:phage shock protein E|uniref:rhodanese-like domain-containing protein n=1 Tax=Fibrella aquatica TaxID=3242487 RepID=UPI003521193C
MRFILTLLFVGIFHWCTGQGQPVVKNSTVSEFKAAVASKAPRQLIDVRTDAEVKTGVIANARQIDFSGPHFQHQLDQLDKNVPVYVYCAVGGRSARAAQVLASKGFKEVYNLSGGIQQWVQAGNPLQPLRP